MKKIFLITNDKISGKKNRFTSNNDLSNIISCLKNHYSPQLICRKSSKKLIYPIREEFKFCKIKEIEENDMNIFMVSITPYNFLSLLKLMLLRKKIKGFVYLRSDGFLEYKIKYGLIGYYFYFLMFYIIKKKLKLLSVSKKFTNVKVKNILHPSEITKKWQKKKILNNNLKTDFLYIGRFKKEKGSFFMSEIFKKSLRNYSLTIVGTKKKFVSKKYYNKNIRFISPVYDEKKLIKLYDSTRVFILPSFTEGFPKVISESLARLKPIIIFDEIYHVINNRKGIFVCKRDEKNIIKKFELIKKDYKKIQNSIIKNFFYTKDHFKKELLISIRHEFRK